MTQKRRPIGICVSRPSIATFLFLLRGDPNESIFLSFPFYIFFTLKAIFLYLKHCNPLIYLFYLKDKKWLCLHKTPKQSSTTVTTATLTKIWRIALQARVTCATGYNTITLSRDNFLVSCGNDKRHWITEWSWFLFYFAHHPPRRPTECLSGAAELFNRKKLAATIALPAQRALQLESAVPPASCRLPFLSFSIFQDNTTPYVAHSVRDRVWIGVVTWTMLRLGSSWEQCQGELLWQDKIYWRRRAYGIWKSCVVARDGVAFRYVVAAASLLSQK